MPAREAGLLLIALRADRFIALLALRSTIVTMFSPRYRGIEVLSIAKLMSCFVLHRESQHIFELDTVFIDRFGIIL